MRARHQIFQKAATTEAPVYIAGVTGTGKELVALAIHRHSARSERPFVVINCGAIPQTLVQSALFGCERGALTGATQPKLGRIELATGGTLLLDPIADLPMDSQPSLHARHDVNGKTGSESENPGSRGYHQRKHKQPTTKR